MRSERLEKAQDWLNDWLDGDDQEREAVEEIYKLAQTCQNVKEFREKVQHIIKQSYPWLKTELENILDLCLTYEI